MKKTIPVIGMACVVCAANVENTLRKLRGVNSATVTLSTRTVLVDYDPDVITLDDMKREVSNAGYDLVVENDRNAEEINRREYTLLRRRTLLSWLFAALTMYFGMSGDGAFNNQICLILALLNMFYCGRRFYVSAAKQITHRTANMDSLVALSTLIAFLFSTFNTFFGEAVWGARGIEWHTYFDASVMIITFVLTGRCLEEKAKDSTASSIRQLMGMQPKTARIVTHEKMEGTDDYRMEEVPISTIQIGDTIEVRAGEKIPVDGVVCAAESFMTADAAYVDEAMISGEPTPAMKKAGDTVLAGTIPSQGKLRMRARQIGENTALAHIIRMVQEAQGSKAPVQRIVDRAARVFVPTVAAIALLTFCMWWAVGGNAALPHAILSAVAVLVIACPCAMGLATPTALMVGIGKAAQKQILIKDASALENLHKIRAIVVDKTGTLTIPNPNIDFTRPSDIPLEERETLKPNAKEAMAHLQSAGIEVYMMSGDKEEAARYWATEAGIRNYRSKVLPGDKQAHVVAMHGEAPLLGVLLSVGLGKPAELVVLYACAPNVEPVHILTRTTVPLAAFAERKRDRTLLELALSLKQSVLVAGFCKALQAWQRDIIPVGPARSVDNKLSFRRHNRLRLVVYIIKNAVAGCEQV